MSLVVWKILEMLDEGKTLKEIAEFFNISIRRLFKIFEKCRFARSIHDYTTEDREKIKRMKEEWGKVRSFISLISGMRCISPEKKPDLIVPLSPVISPEVVRKFVEVGADLEMLKRITYGDITELERYYAWCINPQKGIFLECGGFGDQ